MFDKKHQEACRYKTEGEKSTTIPRVHFSKKSTANDEQKLKNKQLLQSGTLSSGSRLLWASPWQPRLMGIVVLLRETKCTSEHKLVSVFSSKKDLIRRCFPAGSAGGADEHPEGTHQSHGQRAAQLPPIRAHLLLPDGAGLQSRTLSGQSHVSAS